MRESKPAVAIAWIVLGLAAGAADGRSGGADARFAVAIEDVSPLLEPIRAKHALPALAGSIVVGERTVAIGATGVRARGASDPVSAEDRWHLGSCTKAMTATLVAMLVAEGLLSWETTLGEVLPEETAGQPAWRSVTIEQLLHHRSGLPEDRDPSRAPWNQPRSGPLPAQRREIVRAVLAEAPATTPGTGTAYANAGYVIVGTVLEIRTGESYEDLLRTRLFAPLRMTSAGFGPPRPLPQPQGHRNGTPLGVGPAADNPPALGPAATVHASLRDWGRFVSLHLGASTGASALLDRDRLARLRSPAPGSPFAMGWLAFHRDWGGNVVSHAGSNGFWYAVVFAAPERGFAVLVATNEGGDHAARATDEAVGALIRHHLAGDAR